MAQRAMFITGRRSIITVHLNSIKVESLQEENKASHKGFGPL